MRRGLAWTLATAALVALAAPSYALGDESLTSTGSITYTWQGDPARGCAAAGLCAVQGALIVQPQGDTSASSFGGTVSVSIFSPSATIRSSGPGGVCVDVASGFFFGQLSFPRRGHGGVVGRIEPPFSSGRCAGPTAQALARLAVPVRRFGAQRRPSYDVRTSRGFVAGPFTGRLVSTLVLRPSSGGFSSSSSSQSFGPPPAAPPHKVLVEQVTLRYRAASLPSALTTRFSGEPDPFCAALASCGATGTLALSLPRVAQTFVVTASRVVAKRVNSRQAMADLRRGLLSLSPGALVPTASAAAQVSESLRTADGALCQASSTTRQAEVFFTPGPGAARHGLNVVLNDPADAGVMRTYCPGPSDADVFGAHANVLASARVGLAQLVRRRSVFMMSRPGSFAGVGYVGTRGGALQFSLTLERVRAGTVQEVRR